MSTVHVEVVSAEGQIFAGEATAVYAVAGDGEIGILPRHAPLLTKLKPGALRVLATGGEQNIFIGGGIRSTGGAAVTPSHELQTYYSPATPIPTLRASSPASPAATRPTRAIRGQAHTPCRMPAA